MTIQKISAWKPPLIAAAQLKLLERLSEASAISGNEDAVRKIIIQHIKPYADHIEIDSMGNILATKHGLGSGLPRVMLAAHMDEVGMMLTHEEGKGLFRFDIVGGIDARHLPGKPVWVGKDRLPGIIGLNPIHLTSPGDRKNTVPQNNLRIDIGPKNSAAAKPGDAAVFATKFTRLGPSLLGKALDDRLGVATLIELLKNAPPNIDLLAAFTVQEEIGIRGAGVAAHTINPDVAIALDCTPALDLPTWDGRENTLYRSIIDHGPAIYIADGGTLADPRLVNLLTSVGDAYAIPYQIRQPGGGRTDASRIQLQLTGIPSLSVSVPGRYLHTPASLVRLADWKNHIALIHAALSHIDKNTLKGERRL